MLQGWGLEGWGLGLADSGKKEAHTIDTEIKAKRNNDFRISNLQNYESEIESEIRCEVPMWS